MLAQESTQRRAPGFRPGTSLRTCWAGGAELAAPPPPLRHPAPSPGPSRPPRGAPYGRRRSRQKVFQPHDTTTRIAARKPPAPAPRARHATAEGRACPRCPKTSPSSTGKTVGMAVVWTCLPVVVAPSGEGFRGIRGAGCLSGAEGVASSAPPAKTLGARETPARTAGRGRGSRACFLVTSLHEQRSHSGRAGESAPGSMWTGTTVNTKRRSRASHHEAGGQTKPQSGMRRKRKRRPEAPFVKRA